MKKPFTMYVTIPKGMRTNEKKIKLGMAKLYASSPFISPKSKRRYIKELFPKK